MTDREDDQPSIRDQFRDHFQVWLDKPSPEPGPRDHPDFGFLGAIAPPELNEGDAQVYAELSDEVRSNRPDPEGDRNA